MTNGYLDWNFRTLRSKPWIGGAQLTDGIASVSWQEGGAGFAVGMFLGNQTFQTAARPEGAPLSLAAETMELAVQSGNEEDYFRVRRLKSVLGLDSAEIFLEDPIEDVWLIPEDLKTTWVLSRSFSFGTLLNYATHVPTATIVDNPDGTNPTSLTVVNTSPPSAGEFYVNNLADGTSIETDDLTAEAGRLLVLRYHPFRRFVISSVSRQVSDVNGLDYTISLREVVPAGRSYSFA